MNPLKELYQGSEIGYGQCLNGKTYYTVKGPITDQVWEDHFNGVKRLGIIPQRNGMIRFAVIDVDQQGVVFNDFIRGHLDKLGLKYATEKSKSKGFHYVLFFNDWVDGETVHQFLFEEFRQRYGVEVYPTNVKNPIGNFINVPYFGVNRGNPDTYFLKQPSLKDLQVTFNDRPNLPAATVLVKQAYVASDEIERALKTDLSEHFPYLKQKMYCLFYKHRGRSKSASYFKGYDGTFFYKEFGRLENDKEVVFNNIDFLSNHLEIDRMQAIHFINGDDHHMRELHLKLQEFVQESKHPIFNKFSRLREFTLWMAEWLAVHSIDGKAFVSQRFISQRLSIPISNVEYLTTITCLLGFWAKIASSSRGVKSVAVYKMMLPKEDEFNSRANRLMLIGVRQLNQTHLMLQGFKTEDLARAWLWKKDLFLRNHSIKAPN